MEVADGEHERAVAEAAQAIVDDALGRVASPATITPAGATMTRSGRTP